MARPKRGKKGRTPPMRAFGKPDGAFRFFGPSAERDFAVEQGMSEEVFGALQFIGIADDPGNPPCPGPIVIHEEDGAIECEGGCDGVRFAYHGPGATVSCSVHGPSTSHQCSACAGQASG